MAGIPLHVAVLVVVAQLELVSAFSLRPVLYSKSQLSLNHCPIRPSYSFVHAHQKITQLRAGARRKCNHYMKVAADGDVVGVRYRGTLDDGSIFDENPDGPLLEFEVGSGRVIKGFDEAVRGLTVGESREVRCEPEQAYGRYDESNIATIPRPEMPEPPEGLKLEAGLMLQLDNGQVAVIKEVTDESVVLDGNHPLAGKTLNFKVTLHEIKDAEAVARVQMEELVQVLDSPLLKLLAPEITKDEDYVSKTLGRLRGAGDIKAAIKEVLDSREWQAIAAALVNSPKLQQLLQDPAPLQQAQLDIAELAAPAPPVAVTEAEFSDDA